MLYFLYSSFYADSKSEIKYLQVGPNFELFIIAVPINFPMGKTITINYSSCCIFIAHFMSINVKILSLLPDLEVWLKWSRY